MNKYFVEFLVFLFVCVVVICMVVVYFQRQTNPSWRADRGWVTRAVSRKAPTCCLEAACSEECARRQQTQYLIGAIDASDRPNAVRDMIRRADKQLAGAERPGELAAGSGRLE